MKGASCGLGSQGLSWGFRLELNNRIAPEASGPPRFLTTQRSPDFCDPLGKERRGGQGGGDPEPPVEGVSGQKRKSRGASRPICLPCFLIRHHLYTRLKAPGAGSLESLDPGGPDPIPLALWYPRYMGWPIAPPQSASLSPEEGG